MHDIIISGGMSGIGWELTNYFSGMGYHILALYRTRHHENEHMRQQFSIDPFQCNITNHSDLDRLENYMIECNSKPLALINNAGININGRIDQLPKHLYASVINNNLIGTFNLTSLVVDYINRGSILNISSVAPYLGVKGTVAYSSSKSALEGFTKVLSKELAPHINVNNLALGYTDMGMIRDVPDSMRIKLLDTLIPMRRFANRNDVTNFVEYIISPRARYITGQTIHMDGGLT